MFHQVYYIDFLMRSNSYSIVPTKIARSHSKPNLKNISRNFTPGTHSLRIIYRTILFLQTKNNQPQIPLFSTVVPSNSCMFLSCRPFVVNTTCQWFELQDQLQYFIRTMPNMWCHLLYIQDNMNSNPYIMEVLKPKTLPLLQLTPYSIRTMTCHVTRIVQAYF